MACGAYDRFQALATGAVQPEGIDLTYVADWSVRDIFVRMNDDWDIAEMSLSLYMTLKGRGDFPFVALPVFPTRAFRHSFIFINAKAGIRTPKDLEGRRVGTQQYRQTTGLWIRGMLRHDYGVDTDTIRYFEGGVNVPHPPANEGGMRALKALSIEQLGPTQCIDAMLRSGELDAYFASTMPDSFGKTPDVVRLFPDYRAQERAWFERTGIFPINHVLVIRESVHAQHPWVAESIFKACEAAKRWCVEQIRFSGALRYMMPWLMDEIEEMDKLFGANPWPYGVEANRTTLEFLAQLLVEQYFTAEKPEVDKIFAPIVAWTE
jgi:4,5-dihydroxyphthalate decarboxylase